MSTVTVAFDALRRRFNYESFEDLVGRRPVSIMRGRGGWEITFGGDLSSEEEGRVVEWLTTRNDSDLLLRRRAARALAANREFLDLERPTQAEVVAQIKALTRQNQGLIRIVLDRLDDTD